MTFNFSSLMELLSLRINVVYIQAELRHEEDLLWKVWHIFAVGLDSRYWRSVWLICVCVYVCFLCIRFVSEVEDPSLPVEFSGKRLP